MDPHTAGGGVDTSTLMHPRRESNTSNRIRSERHRRPPSEKALRRPIEPRGRLTDTSTKVSDSTGPRMRSLPEVRSRTGCQKTVRTPGQSRTGRWNDDASTPASHLSPVPVKMTTSFSGHYRRGQGGLAQHGGDLLRDHHPPGDTPRASWSSANLGRYDGTAMTQSL